MSDYTVTNLDDVEDSARTTSSASHRTSRARSRRATTGSSCSSSARTTHPTGELVHSYRES
jgi:hypothetical protein